jgi:hypothetical protein
MKAALLCLTILLYPIDASNAEGWRGIIPLRSTRADIERVVEGTVKESKCRSNICSYYLSDVNLFVVYSKGDCKSQESSGWNVPRDTVIRFDVVPKVKPLFSDLKIDEEKFKKKEDPELKGVLHYINDEDGLSLTVQQGVVDGFYYGPSAKDEHLRCPEKVKTAKEIFRQKRLEEILTNQKPQNSDLGTAPVRDDSRYEAAGVYNLEVEFDEEETLKNRATIRQFLWEHWRQRRLGYLELVLFTAIRGVSHRSVFIEPDEKGVWQILVERTGTVATDKSSGKSIVYGPPQITFDVVERIEPTEDGTSPFVSIPENKTLKPNEYLLRLRNSRTGEEAFF